LPIDFEIAADIVNQFDLRPVGVKCIVVSDRLFSGVFPENDIERTAYNA